MFYVRFVSGFFKVQIKKHADRWIETLSVTYWNVLLAANVASLEQRWGTGCSFFFFFLTSVACRCVKSVPFDSLCLWLDGYWPENCHCGTIKHTTQRFLLCFCHHRGGATVSCAFFFPFSAWLSNVKPCDFPPPCILHVYSLYIFL